MPEYEYLKDNPWDFTEKVDGTNIRVMLEGGMISYGGKTDNAALPSPLVQKLDYHFKRSSEIVFNVFPDTLQVPVCLYGEGFGPKIQSGGNYGVEQDFCLFDVKVGKWWLARKDVEDVARKLNIQFAPLIGQGTLQDMIQMVRDGLKSCWGNFLAEGIVARPATELCTRSGERIITKLKHRDFRA